MLLFSGAIGVCAALQQWWLAVGATLLALLVLRGLQALEARIEAKAGPNGNMTGNTGGLVTFWYRFFGRRGLAFMR